METVPSEVYLLLKIDQINTRSKESGATLESILAFVDETYRLAVVARIHKLTKLGVLKADGASENVKYSLTGECDGASEEIKHYVKHRKVPQ